MSSASSIALSGLTAASTRLDAHAQNVANLQSEGYAPVEVTQEALPQGGTVATVSRPSLGEVASDAALAGTVDLAKELVGQLTARRAYEANLATLRAADEAERSVLDVLG